MSTAETHEAPGAREPQEPQEPREAQPERDGAGMGPLVVVGASAGGF